MLKLLSKWQIISHCDGHLPQEYQQIIATDSPGIHDSSESMALLAVIFSSTGFLEYLS